MAEIEPFPAALGQQLMTLSLTKHSTWTQNMAPGPTEFKPIIFSPSLHLKVVETVNGAICWANEPIRSLPQYRLHTVQVSECFLELYSVAAAEGAHRRDII